MPRISCVIFDLDGTLSRTNELIFESFNHIAAKFLDRVFTPHEITRMFGPPEEVAIERLVGPAMKDEALLDFYAHYESHHPRLAEAYDGIDEVLEYLKSRGIALAIFTGKGTRTARITLEATGLKKYFDLVVTGSDVENYKPSADGIRRVMDTLALQPHEVLMVGDSVSDVMAAREAGVSVAAVVWDSYGKERVLALKPAHLFHTVREFSDWLKVIIPANASACAPENGKRGR